VPERRGKAGTNCGAWWSRRGPWTDPITLLRFSVVSCLSIVQINPSRQSPGHSAINSRSFRFSAPMIGCPKKFSRGPESALNFPGISHNVAGSICRYAFCRRSWKVLSFLHYLLPASFSGPTSDVGY